MTKTQTIFVCDNCGAETNKWSGKCFSCGAWNSLKEMRGIIKPQDSRYQSRELFTQNLSKISLDDQQRIKTKIIEFDRVLGGGIILGSMILLAGDPGIGKSTLLLQVAAAIEDCLYVSGEESIYQIKMRAERVGLKSSDFIISDSIDVNQIIELAKKEKPKLLIIDSIQTIGDPETETSPGSMTQVRACGLKLQQMAKTTNIAVVVIGHITKSGAVAGPKTLEHLVDTVLYFEGDKYHGGRILRATKNRFGSTFESGFFEMSAKGLSQVRNPSATFIDSESLKSPGSCVTVTIEGSRPFLFEVQALCPRTVFGYPKRTASGIDLSRLQLLSAVVSEHTRLNLQERDIYVNLVGGMKEKEPAVDLAVCAAIISAAKRKAMPRGAVAIGEIGLTGEIREIPMIEKRMLEAQRQGYKRIFIPRTRKNYKAKGLMISPVSNLAELAKVVGH